MRVSFGLYFPRCGEIWVSKTAFPALWRHLDKNVLINHLLTVSNIDFRILDNRCAQDTNLMTIFHPLPQFFIEFKLHSENIVRRPSPPPPLVQLSNRGRIIISVFPWKFFLCSFVPHKALTTFPRLYALFSRNLWEFFTSEICQGNLFFCIGLYSFWLYMISYSKYIIRLLTSTLKALK